MDSDRHSKTVAITSGGLSPVPAEASTSLLPKMN
jgi:hypothetical protein